MRHHRRRRTNSNTISAPRLETPWPPHTYHLRPRYIVHLPVLEFLCQYLSIQARISTPYHLETEGKAERGNETLLTVLRLLPAGRVGAVVTKAEFSAKNHEASATATPFFDNYGFYSHFESHLTPYDNPPQALDVTSFVNTMPDLHNFLLTQMLSAEDGYETNMNRYGTPAPGYHIGNQVLLWIKNIRTPSTSCKLDWKGLVLMPSIQ